MLVRAGWEKKALAKVYSRRRREDSPMRKRSTWLSSSLANSPAKASRAASLASTFGPKAHAELFVTGAGQEDIAAVDEEVRAAEHGVAGVDLFV
jgi:hypothetical protein